MSIAVLELPEEFDLREGEPFAMEIEGVASEGKLVVKKVQMRRDRGGKVESVEEFLRFCEEMNRNKDLAARLTDQELDDMRWATLKEKHLK